MTGAASDRNNFEWNYVQFHNKFTESEVLQLKSDYTFHDISSTLRWSLKILYCPTCSEDRQEPCLRTHFLTQPAPLVVLRQN